MYRQFDEYYGVNLEIITFIMRWILEIWVRCLLYNTFIMIGWVKFLDNIIDQ
jgi:hypothetical protein